MRKLTHEEILKRQSEAKQSPRLPFYVVLNNIRSLYNVGSIFRTADGAGVAKIWLCGITGHPPNSQISKTALGAEESVEWEYQENFIEVLKQAKQDGYEIVMLEQMAESISYTEYKPKGKVCLVLGNEIEGISDEGVALCDTPIEIEMSGLKNSLNVSVAFGIVAYHIKEFL